MENEKIKVRISACGESNIYEMSENAYKAIDWFITTYSEEYWCDIQKVKDTEITTLDF